MLLSSKYIDLTSNQEKSKDDFIAVNILDTSGGGRRKNQI